MMEEKDPSSVEMRKNLSEDCQEKRYTRQVLIAIMKAIDGTPDEFNEHPLNKNHNLDMKTDDAFSILL
jgi:hypothetical protein